MMNPLPFPTPTWPSMERLDVNNPLRRCYSEDIFPNGDYFPSPYGRVRYWLLGPDTGKKVVLVGELVVPSAIYQYFAPALAEKGYRVLVYDVHGRGYSESPRITHDPNVYSFQLAFLLQYVGWKKANLAGLSMGGSIAASFALSFPHLVDQAVVFIATAGFMKVPPFLKVPYPSGTIVGLPPPHPALGKKPADFWYLQTEHLEGFQPTIYSCVMNGILDHIGGVFEKLAKTDTRYLIVHGTADPLIPLEDAHSVKKAIPQAELFVVEGGHHLVEEEGVREVVLERLTEFLG